jgi:hypothetical protein
VETRGPDHSADLKSKLAADGYVLSFT